MRHAIVVREDEVATSRETSPCVAGSRGTRVAQGYELRLERMVEGRHDIGGRSRAPVVHHQDLESIARKLKALNGLQTASERLGSPVRRNDDRVIEPVGLHYPVALCGESSTRPSRS